MQLPNIRFGLTLVLLAAVLVSISAVIYHHAPVKPLLVQPPRPPVRRLYSSQWWLGAFTVSQFYGCTNNPMSPRDPRRCPSNDAPFFHSGVDIGIDCGGPVFSPFEASVVSIGQCGPGGGWECPRLQLADGFDVLLLHVQKCLIDAGEHVSPRETVARVGSLGNSSGCHLHFEVRPSGGEVGSDVDPSPWLGTDFRNP